MKDIEIEEVLELVDFKRSDQMITLLRLLGVYGGLDEISTTNN